MPEIPAYINGPFSNHFLTNQRLVKPIVLSHGYAGSANDYSSNCRHYASHGYIVFALDHVDGSSMYTQLEDGTEVLFDASQIIGTQDFVDEKCAKRVSEIS